MRPGGARVALEQEQHRVVRRSGRLDLAGIGAGEALREDDVVASADARCVDGGVAQQAHGLERIAREGVELELVPVIGHHDAEVDQELDVVVVRRVAQDRLHRPRDRMGSRAPEPEQGPNGVDVAVGRSRRPSRPWPLVERVDGPVYVADADLPLEAVQRHRHPVAGLGAGRAPRAAIQHVDREPLPWRPRRRPQRRRRGVA